MRNNIENIILDLDGTLLPRNKKIPFFTKLYLKKLNRLGYKIILASGRPAKSVRHFHNQLKLNTPIIALNGHHIHFYDDPNKDIRVYFDPIMIKKISDKFYKKYKVKNIICETDKEIFITNKEGYLDPYFWLLNMKVHYGKLEENLKNSVMTFIIELDQKDFKDEEVIALFDDTPNYTARFWKGSYRGFVEVYDKRENKYQGLLKLKNKYDIDLDKTIFFGDDLNDIDMIENIPNSYAMKNAFEEIKNHTKNITKFDNEHEGVKKELKIILKKK